MFSYYAIAPVAKCFIEKDCQLDTEFFQTYYRSFTDKLLDNEPFPVQNLTEVDTYVLDNLKQFSDLCKTYEQLEIIPKFKKYDVDGSLTIDKKELQDLLTDLGFSTDLDIDETYNVLDTNKNGIIEYNEFRTWFLNGQLNLKYHNDQRDMNFSRKSKKQRFLKMGQDQIWSIEKCGQGLY